MTTGKTYSEVILSLSQDGWSAHEIAVHLAMSPDIVRKVLANLFAVHQRPTKRARPKYHWTPAKDAIVRSNLASDAARMLGISLPTVHRRQRQLGVGFHNILRKPGRPS